MNCKKEVLKREQLALRGLKCCSHCKQIKYIKDFYKHNDTRDNLSSWCKGCIAKTHHNYWLKNKKIRKKYNHKYYLKHKKELSQKVYSYQKTSLKYKIYIKQYKEIHRKEKQAYDILYRQKNKKLLNQKRLKRLKEDLNFRTISNLRNRVRHVLVGEIKSDTTRKLIGCSIIQLRQHLENQFTIGMSWDNYGKKGWEMDHIIPCASFDLSKPEEQQKCFHYTNLQPLWSFDNNSKNAKLNWVKNE